jgi:uncharacterized protein (DUF488 family)
MTHHVFTIGFTRKSLEQFITLLQEGGIDAVIDIRLRNNSQLAGFAKQDDLAFILKSFGIAYEHRPELAATAEILDTYRQDKQWDGYVAKFGPLMTERQAEVHGTDILQRHQAPCLLCSEHTADRCHRRLVAEYWAEHVPELEIVHL